LKVGRFNVDVDGNHPLAGNTLTFEVEITDIREPSKEETQHGHVHGPGGHQH
jgi:FKBP-type peptidyl-prolyl cis-trans isomerase SlyD